MLRAEGVVTNHSSEELSTAIESSFVDVFASLCTASPGAILRNEGDAIIYSSGAPNSLLNGVLAARFDLRNMKKRTEEVLAFFEGRHLPMTFFVGPGCCPPELDDHLRSLGLTAGWTRPGMAADLGTVRRMPLPTGFEIRSAEDIAAFDLCARIFAEGFSSDEAMRQWLYNLAKGYGTSPTRRWFLGILNKKPVATSVVVLDKGIAGIYCVATLQEARGRGVGTAITLEPMLEAKKKGFDFVVLQSSKMGLPVYEKIGFKEYCRIKAYSWSPK